MVIPHGRRTTAAGYKKTKILLRTEGGPALKENAGPAWLLGTWRASGSLNRNNRAPYSSGLFQRHRHPFAREPRTHRLAPTRIHAREWPTSISGCASRSPRDADSVPMRYQEVAVVFIRICLRPAICALGL